VGEWREFVADFAALWVLLTEREQVEVLSAILERIDIDVKHGKLGISLHQGAVGKVSWRPGKSGTQGLMATLSMSKYVRHASMLGVNLAVGVMSGRN
jgi:hypothetical protein